MPFKSKAHKRFLYAKDPGLAAEFEKKTKKGKKLPEKVSRQKTKKSDSSNTKGKIKSPKRDRNRSY